MGNVEKSLFGQLKVQKSGVQNVSGGLGLVKKILRGYQRNLIKT